MSYESIDNFKTNQNYAKHNKETGSLNQSGGNIKYSVAS